MLGRLSGSARRVGQAAGTVAGMASTGRRTAGWAVGTATHLPVAVAGAAVAVTPSVIGLAPSPRRVLGDVVEGTVRISSRVVAEAAQAPVRTVMTAADLARQGRSAAEAAPREAAWVARAVLDLHPRRTRRRVWEGHGHAQIEVRGLVGTGSRRRSLATRVRRALSGLSGVRWAEINAVTGQVLVAFDEPRVDVGTLLEAVRAVEEAQGTREEDFSWDMPVHPSDSTPVGAAVVELAADCVALTAAMVGRIARMPALPRGVRVGLTLLDLQPQLRRLISAQIGPVSTDVVMALAYAGILGLSQRPIGPALDAVHRAQLLSEALSRRSVWNRREPELCCTPEALPNDAPRPCPRPQPLPPGPLESWTERLGPGSLAGAVGVLAVTGEPRRAADTILVAAPRAARLGRESFAATAARRLAGRGVLPLDAMAYRRLDRVSAVVIDSTVLCTDRPQILGAEGEYEDVRGVWSKASRMLQGHTVTGLANGARLTDGQLRLEVDPRIKDPPPGAVALVLREGRRRLGRLTVGGELEPLAEALVDAARESGVRVLLTQHAVVSELVSRADEMLPADQSLAGLVRRLQADGHGVLCISATADDALAASDVGVGVVGDEASVCWSADVLGGPGLEDAWAVLGLMAAARPLTQRLVHVSQAATALGTLMALMGGRRRGGRTHALAPVHSAAVVGLFQGARAARRASGRRAPVPVVHVSWHALDPAQVFERLAEVSPRNGAGEAGPAAAVVREIGTRARGAADTRAVRVVLAPPRGALSLAVAVREELQDPLTPVLALGATASAVVGSAVDAVLVTAVLTGNAFISGAQRLRAEQALRHLLMEQTISARRLPRDRKVREAVDAACRSTGDADDRLGALPLKTVPAPTLVPGDIIALSPSEVVPADARLLVAQDLEVDESTLTGESLPVHKHVEATPGADLTERTCMVFQGTSVLAGSAYAVVVATGDSTEAGRASRAAGLAAPAAGVQARLAEITRMALPATAVGGAGVTGLALLRGLPLRDAIAAGVSVAVAAVPEGLPLVATVAQAGAARRLSRRGVLVRSSRTLEALGRVDTVCFDKTGTLTTGRLAVAAVATADADLDPDEPAARRSVAVAARACPAVDGENIDAVPHATDRAVLEAAANGPPDEDWQLRGECSFEASRGYSASLGVTQGSARLAVKGAPEVVLPLCETVMDLDEDGEEPHPLGDAQRRAAEKTVHRLAEAGLRPLAVAERRSGLPEFTDDVEPLVGELTLLGFIGIADSPRRCAAETVRMMTDAGIRPVMVTGDHPATAGAVARAVGMPADDVVTGAELDRLTEKQRAKRVSEATVFARVSPAQKVRIVEALRASGRVVAMTGDGTNDAAAIRLADVGIGVGTDRSTAARSAADLVLAEPDLPRIHDALVESRAMWHRMREAVSILVGGNAGEVGFMMLGTALAGRAPINIRQMLVVNLLTDMFPALAVALAPPREHEEASGPVGSTLGAQLARAVVVRGGATALGATLAWTMGRYTGRGRRADTMGLAALVGTQLGQTLVIGWRSPLVVGTVLASGLVLVAVVETPGVSRTLGCTPIGPMAWTIVGTSTIVGTLAAVFAPRLVPALATVQA